MYVISLIYSQNYIFTIKILQYMTSQGYVHSIIKNNVATIIFYHPQKNSFTSKLLEDLTNAINILNENENVTVIILKSEGNSVFCSGASFDELLEVDTLEKGKMFFSGFANVINAMRKCTKLIVTRVQGKTVGGGVGLVCASDYAIGTNSCAFKLSEIAIGIGPFVIEPAVSKKIGKNAMMQMTLEPTEWKDSSWALNHNILSKIFETEEEMDHYLDQYTTTLSSYNPEGLQAMKKVYWEDCTHWDTLLTERAQISGRLVLSDFTVNALNKFKNK